MSIPIPREAKYAILIILVVGFLAFGLLRPKASRLKNGQMPPGPPGLPVIGNLLDIPPIHSWLKFKEWSEQYGPVFKLNMFGNTHIVVATEKAANELLRERGNIYSSREEFPMAAKLISRGMQILLMPYDERWRKARKFVASFTLISVVSQYEPVQTEESTRMLHDLIREPECYEEWFERYAGSVIMRLAYGRAVITKNNAQLNTILGMAHDIERAVSPGAYLVDSFPLLMWLPTWLAPFKREAQKLYIKHTGLITELHDRVRAEMDAGMAPPSFTRTFLEKKDEFGLSDQEAAYLIATLFGAGTGTTAATMMSFCLAMCHYPEVQKRLQTEIDMVVPDNRLPQLTDMPQLPTVRAVVKETLRWRPVTAGGVPHKLTQDDIYEGMLIPQGSNVHACQWVIHREEALYPDPEIFNPNRWLEPGWPTYKEPLEKYPNLQGYSAFGFGRRICPGLNIVERSTYLLVARIAWASTITKKHGIEVPLYDYTPGFNTQPNRFQFDLKVRSDARREVIEKEFIAMEEETQHLQTC